MKIVFIASLYAKEVHQFHYLAIIELLKNLGHQVIHTHLTNFDLKQIANSQQTNIKFHQKILQDLKTADLVVAEVTQQGLGIGYTLAQALKASKPVLALTSGELAPVASFLEEHGLLIAHHYRNIRELEKELPFLLSQIEPAKDKKFNVFLSPKLDNYLFKSANNKRLSKSEYLRKLIERDMNQPL